MSDAQIRRRKKLQGKVSEATGALGLTALTLTGLKSKGGQRALRGGLKAVGRTQPKALKPKKLRNTTTGLLATSAGVGGLGAFNFAAYTKAESRKRKPYPVSKSSSFGFFSDQPVQEGIAKRYADAVQTGLRRV